MNDSTVMLGPVVALVLWSFVMWAWMYATRLPAIRSSGMKLDPRVPRGQQMSELPPHVRWKADNFNHLMEQPTLFYAVALALAVIGDDSGVTLTLAWAYVGMRVVHSLFQALVNRIPVRFLLFVVSSLILLALSIRCALQVF